MTRIQGQSAPRGSISSTRAQADVPVATPAPVPSTAQAPAPAPGQSGVDHGRVAGRHVALAAAGAAGGVAAGRSAAGGADEVTSRRFVAATGGQVASAAPAAAGKSGNAFRDALAAGNVGEAAHALKGMGRAEQLKALDGLDKASFKKVVEGVRSGAITDDASVMAVNVAQLSRTSWGRSSDAQVDNLRAAFEAGRVTYSDNPDGKGTANVNAFTDGKGNVTLNRTLARHPELAASALANESVHALAATKADRGSYLHEEAASTVADLRAWSELRKGVPAEALKGPAYAAQEKLHARHAPVESLNEARVVAETAAHYAEALPSASQRARIITDLSADKKAQAALTPEQGEALARAAMRLATDGRAAPKNEAAREAARDAARDQVFALATAMAHAPAATLKATEAHLRELAGADADAVVGGFAGSAKMTRDRTR